MGKMAEDIKTLIKTKCDGQELIDHITNEHPHNNADKIKSSNHMGWIMAGLGIGGLIVAIFQPLIIKAFGG